MKLNMSNISHKSLAIRYRPQNFSDVTEQSSVVKILKYMIENKCWPNSMLFCGAAGTGKTTCARIMAKQINDGEGTPIEIDGASNNSVDNVRKIIEESKFKALDAEYKIYIIDECHVLSSAAWQAMLKLIEEPPAKTIFIFCTTDPQKIPATIHSRIQRFDFNRITFSSIVQRLEYILEQEIKEGNSITYEKAALEYLSKIAAGGMRDAITNMDKCLNYSCDLTVHNVIQALGTQDYDTFFNLLNALLENQADKVLSIIEEEYLTGKDLKQFIKQYILFLLDLCKYKLLENFDYIQIPNTYEDKLKQYTQNDFLFINILRNRMIRLQSEIKWENMPKVYIEAELLNICLNDED
jgi:DNA polymerase-3 subunit gamma/tau